MTLYKLNRLIKDYPIILYIVDHVDIIQQGQSPKSTYVQVQFKNFVNK